MSLINIEKYEHLMHEPFYQKLGKVSKIVGLTIESIGPDAKLNDLCKIYSPDKSQTMFAEVVGFKDSRVLLMPFELLFFLEYCIPIATTTNRYTTIDTIIIISDILFLHSSVFSLTIRV